MYCAQLNDKNICTTVLQTFKSVVGENVIPIQNMDTSLIGKIYNNGVWEEVPIEPIPEPPLTETEQTVLETSLNVEYLMCLAELNN